MIKERFADQVDRLITDLVPSVSRIPLTPDQLTALGVGVSLVAGTAYAFGWVILGGILLIGAGAADLIDGIVARSRGTASAAGAFLDSSLDRLSDLLIFSGIIVGMAWTGRPGGAALVCWALAGATMTSYLRARAEAHGLDLSIGFMERAERFLVLIVCSLINQLEIGLWLIALGSTATSIQRLLAAHRMLSENTTVQAGSLRLVHGEPPSESEKAERDG